MASQCMTQMKALLTRLETGDAAVGATGQAKAHKELLDLGRRWPTQPPPDEAQVVERLVRQLPKFADTQQQTIVAALQPMRERVGQKMIEATTALNRWLGEARDADKGLALKLLETLQGIERSFWFRFYKQCPDLAAKAQFLVATASTVRAVNGEAAPLHAVVAAHPKVSSLVGQIASRAFVVPNHGNILVTWHNGRLDRYNRTFWRAARRAASRLCDDLQVRLVSALRRATAPVQLAGVKTKPQLQIKLRAWPMAGCPLAKAFLDFVAQRGSELGDLGKPSLRECPPHSLRPETLRRLLVRLKAFEVVDGDPDGGSDALGIVRLRWEAVAALAFKAVGTKPKATAPASSPVVAASPAFGGGGAAPPSDKQARSGNSGPPPKLASSSPESAKTVQSKFDGSDTHTLFRMIRRGLRAEDEEWRQSWRHYCKHRRIASELSQGSHSRDVLAGFLEENLSQLMKKSWAKDFMHEAELADNSRQKSESEAPTRSKPAKEAPGTDDAVAAGSKRKRNAAQPKQDSSSDSESSRSQRKQRRNREKQALSKVMSKLGRGKDLRVTPETMMMSQMVGMSMVMNRHYAMMGMGAPMLPLPMPMMPAGSGPKSSKDDKGSRVEGGTPPAKGGKLKFDKRRDSMINSDDL